MAARAALLSCVDCEAHAASRAPRALAHRTRNEPGASSTTSQPRFSTAICCSRRAPRPSRRSRPAEHALAYGRWRPGSRAGRPRDGRLRRDRRRLRAGLRRRGSASRRSLPPRRGTRSGASSAELGGAPIVQADLTVEADVDRLFATAREAVGPLDVCAAVAGVYPGEDVPVWELELARFERTLALNLTATFLTARGFLRAGAAE